MEFVALLLLLTCWALFLPFAGCFYSVADILVHGVERPLSGTDRVAILRTSANHVRYTLISSAEECALKRFVFRKPVRRCELLTRKVCNDEYVLLRKKIKENCTMQKEFCEANHRTQTVMADTIFCEQKYHLNCSEARSEESDEKLICLPRRIAVCNAVPQTVTLTERKQRCNGENFYRTTKMCMTRTDGTGECKSFVGESDECDSRTEMKVVNSEIGHSRVDCSYRKEDNGGGFCYPSNDGCHVVKNETSCFRDQLPKKLELKEVVCEKCVEGRIKVRPVVEIRNVCREETENFCLDVDDEEVTWRKWCKKIDDDVVAARILDETTTKPVEDQEDEKPQAEYHIEVSPGEWVTTSIESEARRLLKRQKVLEKDFVPDEDALETHHDLHSNEVKEEKPEDNEFKKRFTDCLRDVRSCKF